MKNRLKLLRKHLGLNQRDFGSAIGVTSASVSRYEKGEMEPSESVLIAISTTFAINMAWLKTGSGPMEASETTDDMVDRVMQGSNDFAKSVFRAFARLDDRAWQALRQVVDALQSGEIAPPDPQPATKPVHVLGAAAAGLPLNAVADPDETAHVPSKYADASRFRVVRARGDSMEPRIHSGDIVVAAIDTPPEPGQIALVRLAGLADDEYVIKRVTLENGRYILRSDNPTYPPMTYAPEDVRACEAVRDIFPCK